MTATEPELALVEASPDEASASASPTGLGLVGRALLGSTVGVVSSVLAGIIGLEGSYAGARDDVTADQAVTTYQPFLEVVGRELGWLGVAQALLLAPVVLGLLLLLGAHPRTARSVNSRALLPILLGLLAVFAFFVTSAHRHPGPFLSMLAGSRLLSAFVAHGSLVAAFVFGSAALGCVLALVRRRRSKRVQLACALAVGSSGVLALAASQLGSPEGVFGNSTIVPLAAKSSGQPNILMLAVDSLRPDMIDPEHTPHLSALLSESIYFPNTLVTQPRTGPSWAATLTSLPPLLNGVETMFPDANLRELQTFALPAHLAGLGYRTAVFSEYAGEFFARANLGFQVSAVPSVELKEITGQMLMARAPSLLAAATLLYTEGPLGRSLLSRRVNNLLRGMANFSAPEVLADDMLALSRFDRSGANGEPPPFFWLVFYSQPHFPYTSSSDFYPEYQVAGASPELRFGRDATSEAPIATPEDRQQLVGLYRAALAETDAAIGQLLAKLDAEGQLEHTIIVLLADHGEGLYECATCFGHGDNLKSLITLRVPLAFRLPASKFPEAKPGRYDSYVSQLDVYPTISSLLGQRQMSYHEGLPLLGKEGQVEQLPPRDLFAESGEWLWQTPAVPADRIQYPVITAMAKLERGRIVIDAKYNPEIRAAKHRAVIRPPYKLNYEPGAERAEYHLYQFEQDPLETEDLMSSRPELADELKRSLLQSMLRHPQILPVAGYFLTRPEPPPPESF